MKENDKQVIIMADLGFGDAGKGSMTDYLTRQLQAHTIVRYNGGAQAAHNVITPDGRHHTFAQFGSGSFVPGVRTHLSRFMLVNPLNMFKEERHLQSLGVDVFNRTTIEDRALVITPFHQAVNRLKEMARDNNRHGSCGMGIGETQADYLSFKDEVLFMEDLSDRSAVERKMRFLRDIQLEKVRNLNGDLPETDEVTRELLVLNDENIIPYCQDLYTHFVSKVRIVDRDYLRKILQEEGTVIFEGAQGVLLDETYGFYPYTTWSDITFGNAEKLLLESSYDDQKTRLGVLRAYATRHGAGPFVTEDQNLTSLIPDAHNGLGDWQGKWRVGYFDFIATQYALGVIGQVDALALTCLDRLQDISKWRVCNSYSFNGQEIDKIKIWRPTNLNLQEDITRLLEQCTPNYQDVDSRDMRAYVSLLEAALQIPIKILSFGPTACDKEGYL